MQPRTGSKHPRREAHESRQAPDGLGRYALRIKGYLDVRWTELFDGMTHGRDGTTVLLGPVVEQAALYGVLRKVRDLGLLLLSVEAVEPAQTDGWGGWRRG